MFFVTKDTILIGKVAEMLFITKCMIEGIVCYVPASDGGRVDVLVSSLLIRCQVKSIQYGHRFNGLPVRKSGGQKCRTYRYCVRDVDYMIGSDLKTMDVYVVPIEVCSRYKAVISIKALNEGGFKNNLSVLHEKSND